MIVPPKLSDNITQPTQATCINQAPHNSVVHPRCGRVPDGYPPAQRHRPDRIFMIVVDFMFH